MFVMKKLILSLYYSFEVVVGAMLATAPSIHILIVGSRLESRGAMLRKLWVDSILAGFRNAQQGIQPW